MDDLDPDTMEALSQQLGGPEALNSQVGIARGETPGTPHPALSGLSTSQLAQLDRYSDMKSKAKSSGLLGLPFAGALLAGNEAAKLFPKAYNATLGKIRPEFQIDATTSPASLGNVTAGLRGYLSGLSEDTPLTAEDAAKALRAPR